MTNSPTEPKSEKKKLTPWSCLSGAVISGSLGSVLYLLTSSIAQTFAAKPIHSTNTLVINIGSAVRTLVVGIAALGTGIFVVVSVGLVALAIQILIQDLRQHFTTSSK
jgi:Protein of unknown function (DUF3082)